jgi:hypothetical protein
MKNKTLSIVLLIATVTVQVSVNAQSLGRFIGTVQTEWLPDGRRMRLLSGITFVDPIGTRWDAPRGSVVDGASIPKVAWSVVGGPFEGKYRNASVIHDVACDKKEREWETVHRAFYDAMITSGVSPLRAKLMYAAVYHFGPRWPIISTVTVKSNILSPISSEPLQKSEIDELRNSLGRHMREYNAAQGTRIELVATARRRPLILSRLLGFGNASYARVSAEFKLIPPERTLSESGFKRLQAIIIKRQEEGIDVSLNDIENFPGSILLEDNLPFAVPEAP